MAKTRRIVQLLFLAFFIFLFIIARYPYEHGISSDIFLRFSPLMPLFELIHGIKSILPYWPALIILALTPFLGRFFCGWICPLGTTLDITDKVIKVPTNRYEPKWAKLRWLKFAVLFAAIFLAFFSINIWGYFDPLSIFNRVLTIIIYPVTTFFTDNSLLALSNISFMEDGMYTVYDWFKTYFMPEEQAFYQQMWFILIFIATILALEKVSRRFWCRNLCPVGAFLGLLSKFRFFERIVADSCTVCNICTTECKMGAISDESPKISSKVECIECFNCSENCPPKFKSITYEWRWKPYQSKIDYDRRRFIQTSAASLLTLGAMGIGLKNRDNIEKQIRPPGALEEDEFREKCIRCQECVRICESNGGCLQPDSIHNDPLDLWLPVAVMREGYCEYGCNLCGEVCPTDAIMPLELAKKQKFVMGLAHFNKNICIPYDKNKDCIVCEEHCPVPDKAIKFVEKDVVLFDGSVRKVKHPYVIEELCIGCGICETKCPLPGESGIFVTKV